MKDNIIQVIKLVLICMAAAAVLALVYGVTKEPIEKAIAEETEKAVKAVITGYESSMTIDTLTITYNNESFGVFTVKSSNGEIIGRSIVTSSKNGYGGTVELMLGTDNSLSITGIYVLSHKETPGLGSKMDEAWFKDQFNNTRKTEFNYKVEKDGGDVVAITSATITSRAVSEAIDKGLDALESNFPTTLTDDDSEPADSVLQDEGNEMNGEVKDVN